MNWKSQKIKTVLRTTTGEVVELYKGDWNNYPQGTRQNDSVTSGEGGPLSFENEGGIMKSGAPTVYQKHKTLLN